MSTYIQGWVEGALQDAAVDKWNGWAETNINTKDPYRYETPDGKTKKLKLPENASKEDRKMWKWVQRRAWLDDKCFMGCYPIDCGIGLGPLVILIPVIGPVLMYGVHARLTNKAGQYWHLDAKTVAKMQANILFDFLISLPPVLGSLLVWMNGCSTRNAAIIHTQVSRRLMKQEQKESDTGNLRVNNENRAPNKERAFYSKPTTITTAKTTADSNPNSNTNNYQSASLKSPQKLQRKPPSPANANIHPLPPKDYQPQLQNPFYQPTPGGSPNAVNTRTSTMSSNVAPIPHIPFDEPPNIPPRQ